MKTLNEYFQDYASYHRTPGNKVCHYLGIPFIVITLLGLLSGITLWNPVNPEIAEWIRLDAGVLLIGVGMVWYLMLSPGLALAFFPFLILSYAIGRILPLPVLWGVFILGWIFQGIGHYRYEKKSPAFFKNFEHLLIGPLWIFARLIPGKSDN